MFGTDLGAAPLPLQSLLLSVLVHCLLALAALVIPWSYWFPPAVHLLTMQMQAREEALLLPDLQPTGSRGGAAAAPGSGRGEHKSQAAAAGAPAALKAVRGTLYPGPQIIVSNPPHPDNAQQTILQPELPPARLPVPLRVPPMVSIARATPVLVTPPPQPAPPQPAPPAPPVAVLPISVSQQLPAVEAPKLPLPASDPQKTLGAVANVPVPAALPKLARAPVPLANESGNAAHSIVVIDAIPSADARPVAIPAGELHGAFTVAPSGMTASAASDAPGGGTAPTGAPGVGTGTANAAAFGAGTGSAPGVGNGTGTAAAAGAGGEAGPGLGHGPGIAGAGVATGAGSGGAGGTGIGKGVGNGLGTAAGLGSGNGMGAGAGTGSSPFPGITIQGGSSGGGRTSRPVPPSSAGRHASYDVSIVANGASGGGFKDYGVFQDGASYTVYLDMDDLGLNSSWALQYAPAKPNEPDPPVRGIMEPPYATTKQLPRVSGAAARRSHGGTVVVFGVINSSGFWERLRVVQSPDPAFNQPVLDALAKWTFQPAQAQGSPVAVKCLLGVPVYAISGE